jgi:endonuclease-3 related protein
MPATVPLNAHDLYQRLLAAYGPQDWWPAETPLEVVVGAVLTQNTAWRNVALAIEQLRARRLLELEALLAAPEGELKDAIRSSGFYNIKYERLRHVLAFLRERGGIAGAAALPGEPLRAELLAVPGVGPETADSILLYALDKPFFVVDSYTRRLLARLGHAWAERAPYAQVQGWFTGQMPPDTARYNEYHALIVQHCKEHCLKKPACPGCPLAERCPSNGRTPQQRPPLQPSALDDV